MLSERSDFAGGDLATLECDDTLKRHGPWEQGDALIFPSHKYHCVTPVQQGLRRVLVIEVSVRGARRGVTFVLISPRPAVLAWRRAHLRAPLYPVLRSLRLLGGGKPGGTTRTSRATGDRPVVAAILELLSTA